MENILSVENLTFKYKDFKLDNVSFSIPKGYNVALIGSNGAGKTTLMNLLMEFMKAEKGEVIYFEKYKSIEEKGVKNKIGYIPDSNYFGGNWKVDKVSKVMSLAFDNFNRDRFYELVDKFNINPKISILKMSKGTKMRLMLAAQFARDSSLLILDEPTSPLDPVMRDELCDSFREYIKSGEKTVFFSTHNIADMENATDYVIFMKEGKIIEAAFVGDLKEKYIVVRGNSQNIDDIKIYIKDARVNSMGFEGIIFRENLEKVRSLYDIAYETPSLQQIAVMLLKGDKNV